MTMNKNFENEKNLLMYLTIYENPKIQNQLQKIKDTMFDGEWLITSLRGDNYKLRSLFCYNLDKFGIMEYMPDAVKDFFEKERITTREMQLRKIDEIVRIQRMFNEKKIPILVLKGIGMASTVYHDSPYVRDFNDIDILVSAEQAEIVYGILLDEMGYKCKKSSGEQKIYKEFFQHYAPICRDGVYVEMHHRLTQKDDPYEIDTDRIMKEASTIDIQGTSISIPNEEDMLLSLCYHLFQHEYRESRYMLKPYSDIYNFLYHYKDTFHWNKFINNVKSDGLEFPVTYSLYYVNEVYKDLLGEEIVPEDVFKKIMPVDFMEKKDAIVSRHLFNSDSVIGYWDEPHADRIFMETKQLRQELCRKFFFFTSEEFWKKECERLEVPFEENFEFSPRIWEKYGRI